MYQDLSIITDEIFFIIQVFPLNCSIFFYIAVIACIIFGKHKVSYMNPYTYAITVYIVENNCFSMEWNMETRGM
jgi:hypothetical protein